MNKKEKEKLKPILQSIREKSELQEKINIEFKNLASRHSIEITKLEEYISRHIKSHSL